MALELNEIISKLERLLINDLSNTFEELRKLLIPQDDAWDSMVLMEGRYNDVKIKILRDTISEEQSSQRINQIREDLLHFIQDLKEKDLVGYEPTEEATTYEGHLLYKIPLVMNQNESMACLVRIAVEKKALLKYIEVTEDVRQSGLEKISDVMQVELVDPTMSDAFQINAINEPEQLILKKGYTEWRFNVTPLKSGVFPLLLKVAVLILVNGKERKREITLEKEIKVTTIKETELEELAFVESDVKLNMGTSSILSEGKKNIKKTKSPRKKDTRKTRTVVAKTASKPVSNFPPSPAPTISTAPAPQASPKPKSGGLRKIATAMSAVLLLAIGFFMFRGDGDNPETGSQTGPGGIVKVTPPPPKIELASPEHIFGSEKEGSQHFASVEVPPIYETKINKVPIKNSGSTITTNSPSKYRVETRKVLIPGSDPPRYVTKTVKVENKSTTKPTNQPKKFRLDTVIIEKKPLTIEKRRVLGSDEVTSEMLKSMQTKLKEKGYDIGKAGDAQSVVNEKFKTALFQYQKDNALPVGNLDFETLEDLGVEFQRN